MQTNVVKNMNKNHGLIQRFDRGCSHVDITLCKSGLNDTPSRSRHFIRAASVKITFLVRGTHIIFAANAVTP